MDFAADNQAIFFASSFAFVGKNANSRKSEKYVVNLGGGVFCFGAPCIYCAKYGKKNIGGTTQRYFFENKKPDNFLRFFCLRKKATQFIYLNHKKNIYKKRVYFLTRMVFSNPSHYSRNKKRVKNNSALKKEKVL